MTQTVFFSWQSDIESRVGRGLIEDALERAIKALKADAEVSPADRELAVDRDRKGVPGSPPLMETIFGKIDVATAFLSDLTYVGARDGGRRTPNPNVLMEHGWALKALTWRATISVMNTAFGHPEQHPLPFDLQHFARPILFDCPANADKETRANARDALANSLRLALRGILQDETLIAARRPPPPAEPHPDDLSLVERFRGLVPPPLRQFLNQHSFGTPFRRAVLTPFTTLRDDWVGAEFEFHDPELQAALQEVRASAGVLMTLVDTRIYAMDRNVEMGWAKTDHDQLYGISKETLGYVREMDDAATGLGKSLDAFVRLARERARRPAAAVITVDAQPQEDRWARAADLLAELDQDRLQGRLPEIVSRPSLTLRLAPLAALRGFKLTPQAVREVQGRFPPSLEARVDDGADARQWWSAAVPRTNAAPNPETAWRMRLVRPGVLEFETSVGRRIDDDPEIVVSGFRLEALVVRHLDRMSEIVRALGLEGPALAQVGLNGVEDVRLSRPRGIGRKLGQPAFPPVSIAELRDQLGDDLRETLDTIWLAGGWRDGSPSFQGVSWEGYENCEPFRL